MKIIFLSLFIIALFLFSNYNNAVSQQTVSFNVEIETFQRVNAPGLQSYEFAQLNGRWLLIGGRTNGLHNFPSPPDNSAFPTAFANKFMIVYDPVSDTQWSRNMYLDLPMNIADQLRSTNMQSFVNGNTMYIVGGYGKDSAISVGGRDSMITFPRLTAVNISGIMNAIVNGTTIAPFVRSIIDTNLAVTGGSLEKLGDTYVLSVGHKFTGRYGFTQSGQSGVQVYTDEVRKFNIIDNGVNLSIANFSAVNNPAILHRRDLNVVNVINSLGVPELRIYGGVFTKDESTWNNPVNISLSSVTQDNSFSQRFSHYECGNIGIYDSVNNRMSNVFFGGISLYTVDTNTNIPYIDTAGCNGPCVPFINLISVITKFGNNTYKDSLLPIRIPQNQYLGSEMEFIVDQSVPMYENSVIKLNSLNNRTFVGHLYGGIDATEAPSTNPFTHQMYDPSKRGRGTGTTASNKIFKVYITPGVVSVNNISNVVPEKFSLYQNYPNPFNPVTKIRFDIAKPGFVKVNIYDISGKLVNSLVNQNLNVGTYETIFNGNNIASGVYYYTIQVNDYSETKKMILMK